VAATIVLALAAVGGVLGWHRLAEARAGDVTVSWVSAPDCAGARVVERHTTGTGERVGPVVVAERGMRCVLRVRIHNDGQDAVELTHAVLPFMGRGGGAVLKVDQRIEPETWTTPGSSDIDVARVIDRELGPGETLELAVPLVFRERGCSGGAGEGGVSFFYDFPRVEVRTLRRTFEVAAPSDLIHTQGGPSAGCREMRG